MHGKNTRRWLSFLMALTMVLSFTPVNAWATEVEDPLTSVVDPTLSALDNEAETAEHSIGIVEELPSTIPMEEENIQNPKIAEFQTEIDRIMESYLESTELSTEETLTLAAQLDEYALSNARYEIIILAEDMQFAQNDGLITDKEGYTLLENNPSFIVFNDYVMENAPEMTSISLYAGPYTPKTGIRVEVSGSTSDSESSGSITVTAKGSAGGWWGIGSYTTTATITIYNDSGTTATISFDWVATSVNSLTIDGATVSGSSGSKSKSMGAGDSFTVVITTAKNSTENKIVLSNFNIEAAAATSKVAFQYNSLGSITVGGQSTSSGSELDVASSGVELVATPASGATFLGWVNGTTHERLSTSATYTLQAASNMTIIAAFANASSDAWFLVDNAYLTDDLNTASTLGKTIVLIHDGTLPAGDYTIPSGVTLLIPHDDAGTVITTSPPVITSAQSVSVYRTLTMDSGANIIVNGAMSIAASLSASQTKGYNGLPTGNVAQVNMRQGSSITVGSGAFLYAIGYIYGSGSVEIKSSGTVYECFQLRDFRGGDATSTIVDDKATYRLFPLMQYYVQNIQVPMTLKAGAIEYGICSFNITLVGTKITTVPFIGDDGMFQINSGYVIKDYDESTDRLIIEANGSLTVNSYTFTITASIFGITVNTADYFLPLNHNTTVDVKTGSLSINQDLALLPGAEIKIGQGVTCTLGSGTEIVVYDREYWGKYCGEKLNDTETNTEIKPLLYVAGGSITKRTWANTPDASIQINGTVDATNGSIYTTSEGANIYSTDNGQILGVTAGALDTVYQATQTGTNITYVEISVIPAKLKHEDGTYLDTSKATAATTYNHAHYICEHDATGTAETHGVWFAGTHQNTETVTAATCTTDGYTTYTCDCSQHSYTGNVVSAGHTEVTDEAVDATCTTAGKTAGSHCSVCNEVIVAQEEIPALGHEWADGICTRCSKQAEAQTSDGAYHLTLAEALEQTAAGGSVKLLTNVESTVTVDKPVIIVRDNHTAALTLADGLMVCTSNYAYAVTTGFVLHAADCSYDSEVILRMKFYIPDEYLSGDYTICLTKDGRWGPVETKYTMQQLVENGVDNKGRYLACAGVASGEMTRNVNTKIQDAEGNTVTFYSPDGTVSRTEFDYTVRDYVATISSGAYTANEKAAAKALAVYGGYAQQFFNVDPEDPAYSVVSEADRPDLSAITMDSISNIVAPSGDNTGIGLKAFEPFLDSATYLRLKFGLESGYSIEDYTFTMTGPSIANKQLEATLDETTGRYYVDITDIPAAYLDYNYTVTATHKDGSSYTISASVLAWVRQVIKNSTNETQIEMAKALYLYNQAANTLFSK